MSRLYISGPISGRENHNLPEFERTAGELIRLGHRPVIPHVIKPYDSGLTAGETPRWQDNLRGDIIEMLQCEGVVFLDDWNESHGARFEHLIAAGCGMTGYKLVSWFDRSRRPRLEVLFS